MSTTTTNYKLVKPALSDPADITVMNPNWDTIDTELAKRATLEGGKVPYEQLPVAKSWDVVVPTIGWAASDTMQTMNITVNGITEDCNPTYGLKPSGNYATEAEEEMFALIKGLVTSTNLITLYATEAITTSITLTLKEG